MKPGLDAIQTVCSRLGDPQRRFRAIHVAGTNGKGAVCAILDACLHSAGLRTGRYSSPHLVSLNERFCLDGHPLSDITLQKYAKTVENALRNWGQAPSRWGQSPVARWGQSPVRRGDDGPDVTFFEALTAVAFLAFAEARPDFAILECGLGGRLDATNVCVPSLCAITKIGLDHCEWLGGTVEAIAAEKAGIVKPGVPVVLGRNERTVRDVVSARAKAVGAPFIYAPDVADESEIPGDFSLAGTFNRENAVTALAALRTLARSPAPAFDASSLSGTPSPFSKVVWPGRFQRVRNFIIDGAHNPPAARALADALRESLPSGERLNLVAGFCGDKDSDAVLRTLAPFARRGLAVAIANPRSLTAEAAADRMRQAGIDATACPSVEAALDAAGGEPALVCGSLFLAGEALVALGAYPWPAERRDPSELLGAAPRY
ncbi:MAG: bifunctional folylpolyglutamate synthase/dihydrofolate synthase [Kiritimatiellae bacterium]|nr:bifunctional folylpolyglutamate synthase/dihydrofolate synthase [Kiritimatiellia bacterium]